MLIACFALLLLQQPSATTPPSPTGPLASGVMSFHWIDSSRKDPIIPERLREVAARIWYPLEAQAAPVILFSTGRAAAATDYSALAEELASHGFVFAVVESPDHSRMALLDGTAVPATAWAPTRAMLEDFARADSFFEPMNATVSADMRFVLARLQQEARTDRALRVAMDLGRVGMSGHSNGAMAAARACAAEPRCHAFLGIEGTQSREIRKNGVAKPYGLLISDLSLSYDKEGVYRELGIHTRNRFTIFRVAGAGHNTITDMMFTRPGLFSYQIAPSRGLAVERTIAVAFFSEYLRGEKGLQKLNGMPELHVESYP